MKGDIRRKKILDAARRLIEKDGSTRLTTKEIAAEAECSEGTLFNHFKRKEDLLLAVVLENAPVFRDKLTQLRAGRRTVAKNLSAIGMGAIAFFDQLIPLATSLFADINILIRHREAMAEGRRGPQDVFKIVEDYIKAEQRLNRIGGQIAPASAAALVLGPCFQRAFIRAVMGKNMMGSTDREFVETLVVTLVRGLDASDNRPHLQSRKRQKVPLPVIGADRG